jgi:hypothetical protein
VHLLKELPSILWKQKDHYPARFEVFIGGGGGAMKNAVFLDVTPCGACMNLPFRGT